MLKYIKLVVSILLIIIFFILFGLERIQMLSEKGVVISKYEDKPLKFPSPGEIYIKVNKFGFEYIFKEFLSKPYPNICQQRAHLM